MLKGVDERMVSDGDPWYVSTFEWEFSTCDVRLGRFLMRVSTISQRGSLNRSSKLFRVQITGSVLLPEISADGIVVFGRHFKRLESKFTPKILSDIPLAVLPSFQEVIVIGGIGKDGDPFVVLSRSAKKGDTPDINFLYGVGKGAPRFCDCLCERIEVANDD